MESLKGLIEEQLKDLYSAEKQLTKALPAMEKNASSDSLKNAFRKHLTETEGQVRRLEQIGEMLDFRLGGKKCKAMEGLIQEGKEVAQEEGDPHVLDAALIAAAQRVEHYEMASYGFTRSLAERLGEGEVAALLQETLEEEAGANEALTELCQDEIFPESPTGAEDAELEEEEGLDVERRPVRPATSARAKHASRG